MEVTQTKIPGVLILQPKVHGDHRGSFTELFQAKRYREAGIQETFIQTNLSISGKGVLRGLHCQNPNPQGKLVTCLQGEVFDVAVDIRKGSPAFGQWVGVILSGEKKNQLWIPPGLAHGFVVLSEQAYFNYQVTDDYNAPAEFAVKWDDPVIGIEWPYQGEPTLSAKDQSALPLSEIDPGLLMSFDPA